VESHEALKRGEKCPNCRFGLPKHVIQTRKAIFQTVSLSSSVKIEAAPYLPLDRVSVPVRSQPRTAAGGY